MRCLSGSRWQSLWRRLPLLLALLPLLLLLVPCPAFLPLPGSPTAAANSGTAAAAPAAAGYHSGTTTAAAAAATVTLHYSTPHSQEGLQGITQPLVVCQQEP
jgi:hypothetical protein